MAQQPGLPSSIVFAFLFLVPGFLTLVTAFRIGKIQKELDRFDKTAYSLLSSGTSTVILVTIYTIQKGTIPAVFDLSIFLLSLGFVLHVGICFLLGLGVGISAIIYRDEQAVGDHPWEYFRKNAGDPMAAQLRLDDGQEINGQIVLYERTQNSPDVLVYSPSITNPNGTGNNSSTDIEGTIYVNGKKILYIWDTDDIIEPPH